MLTHDSLLLNRELHTHKVVLSEDEMKVYAKLQEFASTKLKAYLKQQEQKLRDEFTYGGKVSNLHFNLSSIVFKFN
jgi:hypothetical protein